MRQTVGQSKDCIKTTYQIQIHEDEAILVTTGEVGAWRGGD